jgi:hypothetical protein
LLLIAALGPFFILFFLIVYTELCAVDSCLGFFFSFFVLFFIQRRVLLVAALGALLQILKRVSNIVSLTTLTALTRLVPCTNLNLVPCTNLNSVTGPLLITSLLLLVSGIPTLEKLVPNIIKQKSLFYWPLWVLFKNKKTPSS